METECVRTPMQLDFVVVYVPRSKLCTRQVYLVPVNDPLGILLDSRRSTSRDFPLTESSYRSSVSYPDSSLFILSFVSVIPFEIAGINGSIALTECDRNLNRSEGVLHVYMNIIVGNNIVTALYILGWNFIHDIIDFVR